MATTIPANDGEFDLHTYPILPKISARAREIYRAGQVQGRNPQVFSKVGDCLTASPNYLVPFGNGDYDLGEYTDLQPTIDYFSAITVREVDGVGLNSFTNPGIAAGSGCTSAGPLDPIWANPAFCESGESPLACEYRLSNPALALIMLGTNDMTFVSADKYEGYLRRILQTTIDAGILPIISTVPPRPDYPDMAAKYNAIIVRLAEENDIPMVNLWLALETKPGFGVNAEHPTKLTLPPDECPACLTQDDLGAGINTHNLTMLMALHEIQFSLSE
jgi:hypothetical protein